MTSIGTEMIGESGVGELASLRLKSVGKGRRRTLPRDPQAAGHGSS